MTKALPIALLAALSIASQADTPAQTTFAALKKLEGTWIGGKGKDECKIVFHITGNGSALTETQFPGLAMEMMSVYHMDGPNTLLLTHYCAAHNAPVMKLLPGGTAKEFRFDFLSATNMKPTDMHIHNVHYRIIDADHIVSEWGGYVDGKPSGAPERFEIHRVKG